MKYAPLVFAGLVAGVYLLFSIVELLLWWLGYDPY